MQLIQGEAMNDPWGIWIVMAFVAPCIWALVSLLDIYFVHDIYNDELDGTLISSAFQFFPWIFVLLGVIEFPNLAEHATFLSVCSGMFAMMSIYYYFRALFRSDDSIGIYMLWDISVLMVPFLAWLWSGEQLLTAQYAGIGLSFLGSIVFLSIDRSVQRSFINIVGVMSLAIVLSSVSAIMLKDAYLLAPGQFIDVFLMYSLGGGLISILIASIQPKATAARLQRFFKLGPSLIALSIAAEIVALVGEVAINRAVDLSPSVSFVQAIETSHAPFVMMFSAILSLIFSVTGNSKAAMVFGCQVRFWKGKLLSMTLMSFGVFLVSL